jgi:hypothetical protein
MIETRQGPNRAAEREEERRACIVERIVADRYLVTYRRRVSLVNTAINQRYTLTVPPIRHMHLQYQTSQVGLKVLLARNGHDHFPSSGGSSQN